MRKEEAFVNQNKKGIALRLCVPNNIVPGGGFIHGAGDNMDFAEETLDEKRTMHATSMILYQYCKKKEEKKKKKRLVLSQNYNGKIFKC